VTLDRHVMGRHPVTVSYYFLPSAPPVIVDLVFTQSVRPESATSNNGLILTYTENVLNESTVFNQVHIKR
jgi:hypothetical protein